MKKTNLLIPFSASLACCSTFFFSSCSEQSIKKKQNPNVIVLLVDDVGWADVGYNNPDHVYSPNIDKLASESMMFTHHYTMPQSTPSRVAAFTGRYPSRLGPPALAASNLPPLPDGIPTLATMFKAEEYETRLCGKWHMGSDTEHGPNNYGFDTSYGSLAGAVGMYDHRYRPGEYANTWHRDHKLIDGYENGVHVTDLVTTEAKRIISEKREKPLFLYLAYHAAHTPLDERGEFVDIPTQLDPNNPNRWLNEDKIKWFNDSKGIIQKESDPEKRLFLAVMYHLDFAIGEVLAELDRTNQRENTIILFSSDNGPQVNWDGNKYPDDLKLTDINQPLPMRGKKLDVYEGGIRVPGFIHWKGVIKPMQENESVHIIDWFPTLANIIGHENHIEYKLDGVDLGPILFENKSLDTDRDLYWIWSNETNRWAVRQGDWKIIKYGVGEPTIDQWQLFNLKNDPREKYNKAKEMPEKVKKMHELYLKQRIKDVKPSW